ncbi:MAG: hypothetical protein ACRDK7_15085 [Solirubrobacteraceae bacterium]
MANRNRGRGGRSRKRRSAAARAGGKPAGAQRLATESAVPAGRRGAPGGREGGRESGRESGRDTQSMGERPRAPWHPLPLSELLILVGAIGAVFGVIRLGHGGISHGGPALVAGIAAVLIGTVEVTLREHLSGYRSHTLLLTLLPVLVFHSATILIVSSLTTMPKLLNVVLVIVDVGLGMFLFRILRTRFVDARRERVFAGRR